MQNFAIIIVVNSKNGRIIHMIPHEKRLVRGILSALLSTFLFITACIFTALILLRVGNVATIIRNTDITGVLEDTELAYYIVNQLNSLPFNNTWIELYDVGNFIKTEAVSEEIGAIFRTYVRALDRNNLEYHLTTDAVLDIVTNLEPEFSYLFSHYMTEADNITLTRTLDDILDFRGLAVSGIIYDVSAGKIVPRLLLSPYMLWGLGILLALTLCFIFLHNSGMIKKAFKHSGIPIALSGFSYLVTGIIFVLFAEMLSGRLLTLSNLISGAMHLPIRSGLVLSATGVILIVVGIFIKQRKPSGGGSI
jgi:hypothetical protein